MNIFVYEHITGGGLIGEHLPPSLAVEGQMMRNALVGDLDAIAGIEIVTLRDPRVEPPAGGAQSIVLSDRAQWGSAFDVLAASADAVWPVAPETGGVLERISRRILDARRTLIGSSPDAIRIAASKRETHRILSADAVASVPTFRIDEARPRHDGPWVAKPDDGCGCEDTRLFPHEAAAVRWVGSRPDATRFVLQPHVPGEALSLCVLARGGTAWLLCVNRQRMQVRNDAFEFTGAEVNAIVDRDEVFASLAQSVVGALPGLHGYCGIDLVLTPSGPAVVDVNPRLTTSWVGLGAALRRNPAALVLDLLKADRFVLPAFERSTVEVRVGT